MAEARIIIRSAPRRLPILHQPRLPSPNPASPIYPEIWIAESRARVPAAELPPERRLDDDEFSVLWTLEDGNITVERATKGKRLYSHDLDAPTVLARLKRRKLIQVRKGKMLLTKLGRELMTEADQEPKRHCEQMKFAANTALKAGKHVWKYDGAWYAILKPQEGDDPTDYPYIYDNDDKFGPYATAAEAEAAWAEDNAKAEEPGSS